MPLTIPRRQKLKIEESSAKRADSDDEDKPSREAMGADARALRRRRINFNASVSQLKEIIGFSGHGHVASELQVVKVHCCGTSTTSFTIF